MENIIIFLFCMICLVILAITLKLVSWAIGRGDKSDLHNYQKDNNTMLCDNPDPNVVNQPPTIDKPPQNEATSKRRKSISIILEDESNGGTEKNESNDLVDRITRFLKKIF